MDAPLHLLNGKFNAALSLDQPELPTLVALGLLPHGKTLQTGGERAARRTLSSFVQVRGHGYRKALSSPLSAESGCSRLSPHLAFVRFQTALRKHQCGPLFFVTCCLLLQ